MGKTWTRLFFSHDHRMHLTNRAYGYFVRIYITYGQPTDGNHDDMFASQDLTMGLKVLNDN